MRKYSKLLTKNNSTSKSDKLKYFVTLRHMRRKMHSGPMTGKRRNSGIQRKKTAG